MVGIASFAMSFVAIGMALVALQHKCISYIAFSIGGLLLVLAFFPFFLLVRHYSRLKSNSQQIAEFLRQGRELRGELLSVRTIPEWTEEMQMKVPHWKVNVQQWLDRNLPEQASGFDVEGFLVDLDTGHNVNGEASRAAQHLEGRMSNLREILREIRR